MLHVATVMANREVFRLAAGHGQDVITALENLGCKPVELTWLGKGEAFDVIFEGQGVIDSQILRALGSPAADAIVQPLAGRGKKLLVADMDSTIIREECIDEIAGVLGLKKKIAPITAAAMRGEMDFKEALRKRVSLLKGVTEAQLQEVFETRVSYSPGARMLVRTLSAHGIETALVSSGFTLFTDQVKDALGFDHVLGNRLKFDGAVLSGQVHEPIVDGVFKKEFLLKLSNGAPEKAVAVGDGANDIPMFEAVGFSLSYRGKPLAEKAAQGRLRHMDLTGILYTLGIPEKAFRQ